MITVTDKDIFVTQFGYELVTYNKCMHCGILVNVQHDILSDKLKVMYPPPHEFAFIVKNITVGDKLDEGVVIERKPKRTQQKLF